MCRACEVPETSRRRRERRRWPVDSGARQAPGVCWPRPRPDVRKVEMKSAKEQHPADETAIDGAHDAVDGVRRASSGSTPDLTEVFGSHQEESTDLRSEREREHLAAYFGAAALPSADRQIEADAPAMSTGAQDTSASETHPDIERLAAIFGPAAEETREPSTRMGEPDASAGGTDIFRHASAWEPTFEGAQHPLSPLAPVESEAAWQSWIADEPVP